MQSQNRTRRSNHQETFSASLYPHGTSELSRALCASAAATFLAASLNVVIRVMEVDALSIRVLVWDRRVLIARRSKTLTKRPDVVNFISEVVYARNAYIRPPAFLRVNSGLSQGNVGVICSDMNPAKATRIWAIKSCSELRKRCPQKPDCGIDVTHEQVSVFKPNSHWLIP